MDGFKWASVVSNRNVDILLNLSQPLVFENRNVDISEKCNDLFQPLVFKNRYFDIS